MAKYLDFFEAVYYINLPARTDRKALFEGRAAQLGIEATLFEAVVPKPEDVRFLYEGHEDPTRAQKVGCTMSHQAVIKEAKEKGLQNVLIFEDDCLFLEGFTDKLTKSVNELRTVEWDLFYMGGEPNNYMEQVSENLYTMKTQGGIYTTHAYAVNSCFYDCILAVNPSHISVIDSFFVNLLPYKRKLFATAELLAVQDSTFSDIWLYMTDSAQIMRDGWDKYIKNGIKLKK